MSPILEKELSKTGAMINSFAAKGLRGGEERGELCAKNRSS